VYVGEETQERRPLIDKVTGQPGTVLFTLTVHFRRETDGRWIADVPEIPGVAACGTSKTEAFAAVRKLSLEIVADRLDQGEDVFTGHPLGSHARAASLAESDDPAAFKIEITPVAVAR
jgi:predicted RNase H-like HicB family nuclease